MLGRRAGSWAFDRCTCEAGWVGRVEAAIALGKIGDRRAGEPLRDAFRNGITTVVGHATVALALEEWAAAPLKERQFVLPSRFLDDRDRSLRCQNRTGLRGRFVEAALRSKSKELEN